MASGSPTILVFEDTLGREEETTTYLERALRALNSIFGGYLSSYEDSYARGLTAYQRACQLLHAALKALRKSGGCLKDLSGCNAPSSWQQRLLTHVRVAAFFHGRKVDARNLP